MSKLKFSRLLLIFIVHGFLDNTGRAIPIDGINTVAENPEFQQESEINRNEAPDFNNNKEKDTTGDTGNDLPQRETVDKEGESAVIKQYGEGSDQQKKSFFPVNLNLPRISLDQDVSRNKDDSVGLQTKQQENSVKEDKKIVDNFRSNPSVNNEETKVIMHPDLQLSPSEQDKNSETQQVQNPGLPNLNLQLSSNQGLPDHETVLQKAGQGTQDQQPNQEILGQSPHLLSLKDGINGEKLPLSNLNTQGQRPGFQNLNNPESEMTNPKPVLQEGNPGLQEGNPGLHQGNPGLQEGNPGLQEGNPGLHQGNPGLQEQGSQGQYLPVLNLGQGLHDQKPDLSKESQTQDLPPLNLNLNTHDQSSLLPHFGPGVQSQSQLLPDLNREKQRENLPLPKFDRKLNLPLLNVGQNVQVEETPDFHPEVNSVNSFSSKIDEPKPSFDISSLNQDQGQNVNLPVLNENQEKSDEALQNQVHSLQEQNNQIMSENKDIQHKLDSENTYQDTDRILVGFATTISQGNYQDENQLNEDKGIVGNVYDDKQQNREHSDDEDGINIQDKFEGIGNIPSDIEQGSDDQPSDPYEDKFRNNDKGDEDFYRLETLHNTGDENNDQEEKEEETHDQFAMDDEDSFNNYHEKKPNQQDVQYDNGVYIDPMSQKPIYREGVVEYNLVSNRNSLNTPSSVVLFYTWIILIVLVAVVTFSAFRYRCLGNGRNHRNGGYRSGEESKRLLDNMYM